MHDRKRYTLEQAKAEAAKRGFEVLRLANGFLLRPVGCDCEKEDWERGCKKYSRLTWLVENLDAVVQSAQRQQQSQEVAQALARDLYQRIDERIRQIAAELGTSHEQYRQPFLDRVIEEYHRYVRQLEEEKLNAEYQLYDQRFEEYVAEAGLMSAEDLMRVAELVHVKQLEGMEELKLAHHWEYGDFPDTCLHPLTRRYSSESKTGWYQCLTPLPLTPEQWQQINDRALLSRLEAADYLDIAESKFDRLKKKLGIEAAEVRPTRSGVHTYNLYRLSDVERIRKEI